MSNRECPECKRVFTAARTNKVYCSRLCMRQAASQRWRAANKERLTAMQRVYREARRARSGVDR